MCLPLSFLAQTKTTFTLLDTNVEVGQIFTTRQIIFGGSPRMLPSSDATVDSVANFMQKNPTVVLEIQSHTDSRGSDTINILLTKARTENICQHLVYKGIAKERLVCKGYGKRQLLITNKQIDKAKTHEEKEALHAINRRTVFKVIAVGAK